MEKWVRANYQPNIPEGKDGRKVTACGEHLALARAAGREGMVPVSYTHLWRFPGLHIFFP